MSRPAALAALLLLAAPAAAAGAEDPHALFESRCADCHQAHAGPFARESLELVGETLRGRETGAPVEAFLKDHVDGLTAEQAALMADMFRRQLTAGGIFERRCRICHDPARDLARRTLTIREGALLGRYSGRDIRAFLAGHGRAEPDEAATLTDLLRWQVETAAED